MGGAASANRWPNGELLGREREREVLDRLLVGARHGLGGPLLIHGEAGVGKTALLEYTVKSGSEFRIVRTVGVEGEMELAFAALQQLCRPFLELIERLPDPQRDAVGVAFGLAGGPAPNPFLVGVAVLGLLAEAARKQPLLCVVDDAQWLDKASAQCLAFVARRLLAESVVMLFATREQGDEFAGLSELRIEGLRADDARGLLGAAIVGRMDERIAEQVLAEARGNPLALLELPQGLSAVELAGGFALP